MVLPPWSPNCGSTLCADRRWVHRLAVRVQREVAKQQLVLVCWWIGGRSFLPLWWHCELWVVNEIIIFSKMLCSSNCSVQDYLVLDRTINWKNNHFYLPFSLWLNCFHLYWRLVAECASDDLYMQVINVNKLNFVLIKRTSYGKVIF